MTLNEENKIAIVNGKPIKLSRREFTLLKYLYDHRNRLVTEQELAEFLWSTPMKSRVVMTVISRIRKKICYECIETRYGLGYKYIDV